MGRRLELVRSAIDSSWQHPNTSIEWHSTIFDPVVLTFHSDNSIDKQLLYCVRPTAAAEYGFSIEPRQRRPVYNGGGTGAPDTSAMLSAASMNVDPIGESLVTFQLLGEDSSAGALNKCAGTRARRDTC
jgi:hypothetical protein